jgi:hypothetical protein
LKSTTKRALPLPAPPKPEKQLLVPSSKEKHIANLPRPPDDNFIALEAFRKAKGLCMCCAEKWTKDHRCPPTIQLYVVEELLNLFSIHEYALASNDVSG